jgi:hypothetical protein
MPVDYVLVFVRVIDLGTAAGESNRFFRRSNRVEVLGNNFQEKGYEEIEYGTSMLIIPSHLRTHQ